MFQRAPTLGGECYTSTGRYSACGNRRYGFNGHPPLGVNATCTPKESSASDRLFQRAPTLGGECYPLQDRTSRRLVPFQRAPTLGGECYEGETFDNLFLINSFNGHPPLGVNATFICGSTSDKQSQFQRAPTLGGECYRSGAVSCSATGSFVSTGTHPWG